MVCMKCTFFCALSSFPIPVPVGLLSRSRLWGTQGAHSANLSAGRAPWRVLWAFKVAKNLAVITGLLSAGLEPRKIQWKPHIFSYYSRCCCISHRPSSSQALYFCGSHSATAVAHQALPSSCDSHGRCFFMSHNIISRS